MPLQGLHSVRSSDRRRSQWCSSRIYSEGTAYSTGGCTGKIPGRKTVFCKLLSASGKKQEGSREAQHLPMK